jgi:copper homeostasis protein
MYTLEVIAFTIASVVKAGESGAQRIELCDNPGEGGTTPSYGMIRMAREKTNLQLYPIIRPRGGDFLYSDDEFRMMMHDIQMCKEIGCDGVVIGLLKPDGSVDGLRTAKLVNAAYPMGVTFHRAFDRVRNAEESLEQVIQCGCERILTSGLRPGVTEGVDTIKMLVEKAGDRIIIMPGSGLRSANIESIARKTGAREFHSSARRNVQTGMSYQNPGMSEQLLVTDLDEEEVRAMAVILRKLQGEPKTET